MARKKLSRNASCPCGSGKKYNVCCLKKGIEYLEEGGGAIHQSVPMTDDVAEVLRVQREKFVERFGREPGPDDPLFFDLPHVEHLEAMMVTDMKAAGMGQSRSEACENSLFYRHFLRVGFRRTPAITFFFRPNSDQPPTRQNEAWNPSGEAQSRIRLEQIELAENRPLTKATGCMRSFCSKLNSSSLNRSPFCGASSSTTV